MQASLAVWAGLALGLAGGRALPKVAPLGPVPISVGDTSAKGLTRGPVGGGGAGSKKNSWEG